MPSIDHPFHSPRLIRWRKLAAITVAVGMLAFVIWTLPNWAEFWNNVAQFPSLWHIPANRRIIIALFIKITSPVLIMSMMGSVIWLYSLMTSSQEEGSEKNARSEQEQHGTFAERWLYSNGASSSMSEQASKASNGMFSMQSRFQPAPGSPGYNPVTPLPPILSTEASTNSAFPTKNSPPGKNAGQSSENSPLGASSHVAPSLQISPLLQTLVASSESISSAPLLSLRLLKDVSVTINSPGGGHVVVPLSLNSKRVQLLAYIAWRRGELIARDRILEHVFGWGLSDEEATEEKLAERFESHKKLLRRKIREVIVEHINKPAGKQIIDPDQVDPFVSNSGFWGLSDCCRVVDLEAIEASHKVIALARKDGKMVDEIPEYVKESCDRLIANYAGDFLESLIKKYPSEFRAWQGHSPWARKPYTLYRDYYLDALWYAAEYEWRMGQRTANDDRKMEEETQRKQQGYFGRAAQKYQSYAMYACNSKFDIKATFGVHGEFGERVGMSERALRRCVVLLGAIGRTDLIEQVWSAYYAQMKSASDHRWQPSKETQ
ncbi:MAG TPA: hypothetical protein VH593_00250, partial [Ktedonobacteraceae bacterium]